MKIIWRAFKYTRQIYIIQVEHCSVKYETSKITTLNFKTLPVRLQKVVLKFIKLLITQKSRHQNSDFDTILK